MKRKQVGEENVPFLVSMTCSVIQNHCDVQQRRYFRGTLLIKVIIDRAIPFFRLDERVGWANHGWAIIGAWKTGVCFELSTLKYS